MALVWVSVGSNRQRERNVRGAVAALRERFGEVRVSPVYETDPVGFAGAPFYNLVAGFVTDLPPQAVRQALRAIEDAHGRDRSGPRFGPRTLDLDLLVYGDLVGEVAGKPLPHPDVLAYDFVLAPLADVAPAEPYPGTTTTYAALWRERAARQDGPLRRVAFDWTGTG